MSRAPRWLAIAVLALGAAVAALAVGQSLLAFRSGAGSSTATSSGLAALPSKITRDDAIALVRSKTDQIGRIDRIDARLVTYAEYLQVAGPIHVPPGDPRTTPDPNGVTGWIGDPATRSLWIVAVSGEVWPQFRVPTFFGHAPPTTPTPYPPYRWGLILVDARRGEFSGFAAAGIAEDWPPVFGRLPDHPATTTLVSPSPTPSLAPIGVPKLGPEAMSEVMRTFYAGAAPRIDRIQYKLMTALEFRSTGLSLPTYVRDDAAVWVVAAGGDIPSLKKSPSDPPSYRSVLYVVDANTSRTDSVIASWGDANAAWPSGFDQLPEHPAVAAPYPTTP